MERITSFEQARVIADIRAKLHHHASPRHGRHDDTLLRKRASPAIAENGSVQTASRRMTQCSTLCFFRHNTQTRRRCQWLSVHLGQVRRRASPRQLSQILSRVWNINAHQVRSDDAVAIRCLLSGLELPHRSSRSSHSYF